MRQSIDANVPPGQTVTHTFPVLHAGRVPIVNLDQWRLRIFGEVEEEQQLTWADMLALPSRTYQTDIHCVTGWSKLGTRWEGIPTRALWDCIRPAEGVTHVMVHAMNGFSTNLAITDFLAEGSFFGLKFEGADLPPEHGGPIRLVVPHLYFWKSAKWVTGMQLLAEDRPGYWEERGYHMRGDPWQEERYW